MELTATWTDTAGVVHTVHTIKDAAESQADFETRHNEAVARQIAKYPPAQGLK